MAINSLTASSDKILLLPLCSLNSSKGSIIPNQLVKQNFATDGSVTNSIKKSKIRKDTNCKSPYLNSDKVNLLSRMTEKRVVQKKASDFVSSFPLAVKIYKANSDEFKAVKQNNKRSKKSVLTLPNEQVPVPQTCTVSDMNGSDDFNHEDDNRKKRSKRRSMVPNRRSRNNFEFNDRDARYCSQFNIRLDCSSSDVIRNFNGDGKQSSNRKKQFNTPKSKLEGKFNGHEVWEVLRNINRFQFRPSPPMSEECIPVSRRKDKEMRFNRKNTRLIETCRTEEFAYISSIEVENKSPRSFSHSSSFDRMTVIDKKDEFSRICEEFQKSLAKTHSVKDSKNKKMHQNKNKSLKQKSIRNSNKVSTSNESSQPAIVNNKEWDMKATYENSGLTSTYSSSVVNKDYLSLNKSNDTQQKIKIEKQGSVLNHSEIESNFKSSTNPILSKVCLQKPLKVNNKPLEICREKCNQLMNGITKVVLLKGQAVVPKKHLETTKRKSRLAATLTNASTVPKLTQTDIRRRLLNMKLPLVILGKDQVSSTIQVMDYDPPQFDGLDKHIWPFMIEWSDDYKLKEEIEEGSKSKDTLFKIDTKHSKDSITQKRRYKNIYGDYKSNRTIKKSSLSGSKPPSNTEKKMSNESKLFLNKKEHIAAMDSMAVITSIEQPKKQKPKHQYKDKMLKFLYKQPQVNDTIGENPKITVQCDGKGRKNIPGEIKQLNKTDYCVVSENKIRDTVKNYYASKPLLYSSNIKLNYQRTLALKRSSAKAKWASDFIENVIKKIKNGVYYSQDLKYECQRSSIAAKEVSVQTKLVSAHLNKKKSLDSELDQPCAQSLIKQDLYKMLPGFDNSLPELEVQTLDTDKIEIKHCLTNIIVQFDVTITRDSNALGILTKKSCSLIPLDKNENNTKLFKCKATILNAILPAELCSILPNMMRKIVNSDSIKTNNPLPINKTDSQLSTISELSYFDCFGHFRAIAQPYFLSQEIRKILAGKFSQKKPGTLHKVKRIPFPLTETINNLVIYKLSITNVLNPVQYIPKIIEYKNIPLALNKQEKLCKLQSISCTNVLPYNHQTCMLIPDNQKFNLRNILEKVWASYKMFGPLNTNFSMPTCTITLDIPNNGMVDTKKIIININNLKFDSVLKYAKMKDECDALCGKDSVPEKYSISDAPFSGIKPFKKVTQIHGNNHKIKKKCFVKLYKKCKSTSNILNEKSIFSLSKVTCLDDFFQLLGSKTLSCVFDGNSGKKILSSLITMKNWITEINSRQALLVLLLANKKDNPNLIRFRPVLLQGIAVNRITRASELDMEIEVIEREKLNGFSQFDGISYLPASTENKDNLLEELQWIAKTTASDYQRPFDDSSEKLLKSLLEKRKQLNPSYLRVMARYVGLGLLKSSKKKTNF